MIIDERGRMIDCTSDLEEPKICSNGTFFLTSWQPPSCSSLDVAPQKPGNSGEELPHPLILTKPETGE